MKSLVEDLRTHMKLNELSWSDLEVLQRILMLEESQATDLADKHALERAYAAIENEIETRIISIKEQVEEACPFTGE